MIPREEEIKDMTVPRLFQGLSSGKSTGTAVLEQASVSKAVYFKDGDMIFASSNQSEDSPAEFLFREGVITEAQYAASSEIAKKTSKKQETVLVELGFITPKDLVGGVRNQVKHVILSLFSWREGKFRFIEGQIPHGEVIPLRMSTANLILEGINKVDWKVVRKSLPPLNTIMRPAADVAALFQSISLSTEQKNILTLINGKRTIEELCANSSIGDYNTLKTLYVFLNIRMAEIGEITSDEEAAFVQEAVREAMAAAEAKPAADEAAAVRKRVLDAYDRLERLDLYAALGVPADAGPQDIKRAFFKLSKLYHPDRHFDSEMSDMKGKLEALFIRIHEAYTTLSDQSKRAEYDRSRAEKDDGAALEKERAEKAEKAKVQTARGVEEYKAGNYWGAMECFEWALRLDQDDADTMYYMGLSLLHIPRRWPEAEEHFKNAIEKDPSKAKYHIGLGRYYLKNEQNKQALAQFQEALNLDPSSEPAKRGIAASAGMTAAANNHLERKKSPVNANKIGIEEQQRPSENPDQ